MKEQVIKNEKQFAQWFRKNYKELGYSKIIRGDISRCPDFIMLRNGKEVRVELETISSNFIAHKHSLDSIDEIICLIKDVDLGKPTREIKELKFEGNRKVTLSLDDKVYSDFQRFCEENAIMLSKKIELLMRDLLNKKKNFLLMFFLGIFFISFVSSSTILFDGFESGGLANWTLWSNAGANSNWTASSTDPNTGTFHANGNPRTTNDPGIIMNQSINTSGYKNITFSYARKLNLGTSLKTFRAKWYNGTIWTIVENANNTVDSVYVNKNFTLSSSADNNSNFKISFDCTEGTTTDYCRVDDVNISGNVIDTTPPQISITYPLNSSYNINVTALNYTASDNSALDKCWYSLNNGVTNTTITCGNNVSGLSSNEGSNTWKVWANDTAGNLNSSSKTFFVDTISPNISIISPLNQTFTNATILVNLSASDSNGVSQIWFYNGTANVSYSSPAYYTFPQGSTTIIAYANDTIGNLNSSNKTFFVDSVIPSIVIYSPLNTTYNSSSVFLNYSASDSSGISACWYSRDSNPNISLVGCSTATLTGFSDGSHNIRVYANDTAGNLNSSTAYFSADSTPPSWSGVQSSTPGAYSAQVSYFNVTWNDSSGVSSVLFESNFSGSNQNYSMSLISGNVYGFNATLPAGTFYWKSYANDTLGNLNVSASQIFTISKASNPVDLYINGNKNQNTTVFYGNQTNVTGAAFSGGISIYKNGVLISNPEIAVLAANLSGYIYNATSAGNQNYTSNSTIIYLIVNKSTPGLNMLINGNASSSSLVYGNVSNLTSYEFNSGDDDVVYTLYRDGIAIGLGSSVQDVGVLGVQNYTYTYNTSGGSNYSSNSLARNLEISKASPNVTLLLDGSSSDLSISINDVLNVSASIYSPSTGSIDLYEDSSLNSSGTIISIQKNYTSLGNRVWKTVFLGNQNYSAQNISYTVSVIDSNSPHFSNIKVSPSSQSTYSPNRTYQFNITWTDDIAIDNVIFSFNGTNYSFSSGQVKRNADEYYMNISNLGAGTYVYRWYANDTSGNLVATSNQNYIVDKEIAALFLTIVPSSSVAYGTQTSVSCSANNFESSLSLTRNAAGVSNPDVNNFSVGTYNYACTSVATQNYTSASATASLLVSKAAPVINISLNGVSSDLALPSSGGLVEINASLVSPSSGTINLSIDGSFVASNSSFIHYTNSFSSSGTHLVNVSFDGDENYSFGYSNYNVVVASPSSSGSSSGGSNGGSSVKSFVVQKKADLYVGSIPALVVSSPGVKKIVSWDVKNNGSSFLNDCKFKSAGSYASWITKTETKGLAAGEEYSFVFDVNIPEESKEGKYLMHVLLDCSEVSKSADFFVEIQGKQVDFKLVDVERAGKGNVKVKYNISELKGINQNLELQFLIFSLDNKKEAEVKEAKSILANSSQEFETTIPIKETLQGDLSLLVNINSETYSSFVQENIVLGSPVSGFTIFGGLARRDSLISISLVLLFFVFAFFIVKRIRSHHRVIKGNRLRQKYASMLAAY
ncbi:hypothetical protein HY212_03220 [Candidatus Pacearchaeota archaeon]|nr:hypothetical protein [Candidatus Pacearchaeota archaeon]